MTKPLPKHVINLRHTVQATVSNQYFDLMEPFAPPRHRNHCEPFICGRDYMQAVANAIKSAEHFIFIADWQLDYDVELEKRGVKGHPGRLSELLANALERGVHIRILCYDSPDAITKTLDLAGESGPPDTHDEAAQEKLEGLKGKGSIDVMLQGPNTTRTMIPGLFNGNINFSHHQKFVLVDGHTAFLGGIDLAYGRWETPNCHVVLDPSIHILNDGYNMQLVPARTATEAELALTKKQTNGRPGFEPPHYTLAKKLLDPATQPREPWNDVALSVNGPAAYDVFVNFVLRWNSFARKKTNLLDKTLSVPWFEKQAKGHTTLVDPLQPGSGSCSVQIGRSVSTEQLGDELKLWDEARKYVHDDWKQDNPQRRQVMQEARKIWQARHQTNIHDAMVNSIRAAQACIYIENQFFISNCGKDNLGAASPAENQIVTELANAVGKAIFAERAFHIWLMLPEHPEGHLEDKATKSQTWWALQGVKHASNSLIKQINRYLLAKQGQPTSGDPTAAIAALGLEDTWRDYLTVLNLRNYGHTENNVLTEMVYIHSKLMIVDDAVAIIGSANINDRSLNGNGDTEIAAIVVDTAQAQLTPMGQGIKAPTRYFARNLRIQLWEKHLAMRIDEASTGVQKEASPPNGINLEQPLDPATIKAIRELAASNRNTYNQVFIHTPRDSFTTLLEGRNLYPKNIVRVKKYEINGTPIGNVSPSGELRDAFVWVNEETPPDFSRLPALQPAFMKDRWHQVEAAIAQLRSGIRGFIVEMPLDWGSDEAATPLPPRRDPTLIAEKGQEFSKEGDLS